MSGPDWKDALPKPPAGAVLREAWFTTFDPPDAGLLVDDLLPSLLGLDSSDAEQRLRFFGELDRNLRGRLTIISSPPCVARGTASYPWLWRYVSHFTVGEKKSAVQHAKLWAFHWEKGDEETLELHVSSTNLTESTFKNQLQAGWRCCVPLNEKPTKARQQGWGDLVPFLQALGTSAGEEAKKRTERLIALLGRAVCPEGVTFVATIPRHAKRPAQAIKKTKPSEIHILTPTVGEWSESMLKAWCEDAGVTGDQVHLKWINAGHPWKTGWSLTKQAQKVLKGKRINVDELPSKLQLHDDHKDEDTRWSHAKLYLLSFPDKRKKRHLLLTSANWSASAWGAGRQNARNFELGVLFETNWKKLEEWTAPLKSPFCSDKQQEPEPNNHLHWAEASWDGRQITPLARSSDKASPITAVVKFTNDTEKRVRLRAGKALMKWSNAKNTPLIACFKQGGETLEIPVLDLRPPEEFVRTPLPEVDPSESQRLRDEFLLEKYGGPAADTESIGRQNGEPPTTGTSASAADYTVEAWKDSRTAFDVIDQWKDALKKAEENPDLEDQIRIDGNDLRALYERRRKETALQRQLVGEEAAAQLAAEELKWRLEKKKS